MLSSCNTLLIKKNNFAFVKDITAFKISEMIQVNYVLNLGCKFGYAKLDRPLERILSIHQQTYDADVKSLQKLVLKK